MLIELTLILPNHIFRFSDATEPRYSKVYHTYDSNDASREQLDKLAAFTFCKSVGRDAVDAIEMASKDDRVKGILGRCRHVAFGIFAPWSFPCLAGEMAS